MKNLTDLVRVSINILIDKKLIRVITNDHICVKM